MLGTTNKVTMQIFEVIADILKIMAYTKSITNYSQQWKKIIRVHRFSKNQGAALKVWARAGWQEKIPTLKTQIWGATARNLVARDLHTPDNNNNNAERYIGRAIFAGGKPSFFSSARNSCYEHSDVSVHILRQFFVISRTVNSRSLWISQRTVLPPFSITCSGI
jgi:hypothetical protein